MTELTLEDLKEINEWALLAEEEQFTPKSDTWDKVINLIAIAEEEEKMAKVERIIDRKKGV